MAMHICPQLASVWLKNLTVQEEEWSGERGEREEQKGRSRRCLPPTEVVYKPESACK